MGLLRVSKQLLPMESEFQVDNARAKRMCNEYGWTIKETGKHSKGAQFTIIIPETSKMGALNHKIV